MELKESATLVERVKALHGEQCHELQKQIEEVTVDKQLVLCSH